MKILSRSKSGKVHEAELTSFEAAASQWFADNLDTSPETSSIEATAALALAIIPKNHLDPDYVEYLSDGTLKIGDDGTVVDTIGESGDAGEVFEGNRTDGGAR